MRTKYDKYLWRFGFYQPTFAARIIYIYILFFFGWISTRPSSMWHEAVWNERRSSAKSPFAQSIDSHHEQTRAVVVVEKPFSKRWQHSVMLTNTNTLAHMARERKNKINDAKTGADKQYERQKREEKKNENETKVSMQTHRQRGDRLVPKLEAISNGAL